MIDNLHTWLNERETIHGLGNDVLLRNTYEMDRETDLGALNVSAIVDAHNALPKLLASVKKVLELHKRKTAFDGELDYCGICVESEGAYWPCQTVKKIQESISDETHS